MANLLQQIKDRAKAANKTIVLCEGEDERVVRAAEQVTKEGIAKIVLIGNEAECKKVVPDVDLTGITVVDPETSEKTA
ncbi:MAG: phosphate acetyltransferase, partial [Clostridia bacterium]|nr:phosphate acetyltransferase [Clostridia bacterium]